MDNKKLLSWPILRFIVLKFKLLLRTHNWTLPITLMVMGVIVLGSGVGKSTHKSFLASFLGIQPAIAQRVSPSDVWQQVYQQLPDFPKENKYISKETGKVAENNTLASRLIRYHIYVKERAPNYRLDWKLTLADYLDANEIMYDMTYPGNDALRENPIEGDRAAIKRLSRSQRDAVVQVLTNIFTPSPNTTTTPQ
ncbi:MAG: hypothetical protein KME32_01520 [Mojavia pulchra JT2-VF2]|jgi:hypothetical protein|uniref:Uncharacterized protein n=1 Tax=Mojavia pulchra JT2-VF2 TaxID=287848 RepID=A0A951PT65_9NOST|nr:hypothetical protein [Mojavia pulchra JT2-VF2]